MFNTAVTAMPSSIGGALEMGFDLFFSRIFWSSRKQLTFFIMQEGGIVEEGTMVALEGMMVAFLET